MCGDARVEVRGAGRMAAGRDASRTDTAKRTGAQVDFDGLRGRDG